MCAPGKQVDEVHGRCTSYHAVKVIWEFLNRLEALSTTSRAAKVVRFVVPLVIE